MSVLKNIEPSRVFYYFDEICKIPHASYHEKAISDYLVNFATSHDLECYQDALNNVIIIKEASKGYEKIEPIAIQGHMDMVAEKEQDCTKDMLSEGLDVAVEGDFVYAQKTTLGADDGIAVAMALALLEDEELSHPRIEFICTVSEEVGMEGASGIDLSVIQSKRLLNLDSEEEGIFIVGCAGGAALTMTKEYAVNKKTGTLVKIFVEKCTGGHSGEEINKGRANANYILNRLLTRASLIGSLQLVSFNGGSKDNAIPRSSVVEFLVEKEQLSEIIEGINDEANKIKSEYCISDPQMEIRVTSNTDVEAEAFSGDDSNRIIGFLNCLPNGVITMSQDIAGMVETSLNLGILSFEAGCFKATILARSSVDSAKDALISRVRNIADNFGMKSDIHGAYPAWEYKKNSVFRDRMIEIYQKMFSKSPSVLTMHAGVECGVLIDKVDGLESVSIGPDIFDIHTPCEKLSISSTKRVYEYVRKIIENK